jgi:hypothetical protein
VRRQNCLRVSVGRARDWHRNGVGRRLLLLRALTRLTVYFLLCLAHRTPNLSLHGQVLGYLLIMSMTIAIVSLSNLRSYCKVERSTCHSRGPSGVVGENIFDWIGHHLILRRAWMATCYAWRCAGVNFGPFQYLSFSFACLLNLFYERP